MMKILGMLKTLSKAQIIILSTIAVLIVAGSVLLVTLSLKPEKEKPVDKNNKEQTEQDDRYELPVPDEEDPQSIVVEEQKEDSGAETDIEDVITQERPSPAGIGIDVSKYQGTIDWKKVAASGIEFAMIRVGHRTLKTGVVTEDTKAKYNLQEATKYGIKVGAYFFSTAVNEKEVNEEVAFVTSIIDKYQITYPVAYDCEGFDDSENRQYNMSIAERTNMAILFMNKISDHGYTPMFYGSKSDMEDEIQWDMDRISSIYNVWVAQYPAAPYPQTPASTYSGPHVMWQYTSKGSVPGIKGNVDMNVAYFGYEGSDGPKDDETPEEVKPDVESGMTFVDVNEQVTAKELTNLRTAPKQGEDNVAYALKNGEVATRTGTSPSGWSRVVYNGNTYYALSSLLTTDLNYKPPVDDGINTVFTPVNNVKMTAKIEVNLRLKPSVDDSIAPVVATIRKGDIVIVTGENTDVRWSRVVYNGQTLYCVSSYLEPVSE